MKPLLHIATSNNNKYQELSCALKEHFDCKSTPLDLLEIQGTSQEIIQHKLKAAYNTLKQPVLVDDVAVCMEELGGFPGPYIKDFLGYLDAKSIANRFEASKVRAYCFIGVQLDNDTRHIIKGEVMGSIVQPRGEYRFGFDPIFLPEGSQKTFAQMLPKEKNQISHRGKALDKLKSIVYSF